MITAICIGGPLDGQTKSVLHGNRFIGYDIDPLAASAALPPPYAYNAERIQGETFSFYIWRWAGWSLDDCLARLLCGYNPETADVMLAERQNALRNAQ
jgi:hypothetical protein